MASAWLLADAGPGTLPPFPGGALADPSRLYLTPRAQWEDASGSRGPGTQATGAVNVNSGADPYLLLDPTQAGGSNQPGVNQVVAIVSDASATASVLPCFAEVSYSPLYLEPR